MKNIRIGVAVPAIVAIFAVGVYLFAVGSIGSSPRTADESGSTATLDRDPGVLPDELKTALQGLEDH